MESDTVYSATIEIPKGSDRRVHMAYDGSGFIDLGPIKDQIPVNDGVMPVHYGYLNGIMNEKEKDEMDVLVFSSRPLKTGDVLEAEIIGMLTRKDGDHKMITIDRSIKIKGFDDLPNQERDLILKYFGYKSEIVSVDSKEKALEYLQNL